MKCKSFKCKYLSYNSPHNRNSYKESHMTTCWCNLTNQYMYIDTSPFRENKNEISIKDYCGVPSIIKKLENEKNEYIKILTELENV